MANKIGKVANKENNDKLGMVEDLFNEVQEEVNEDVVKEAKIQIKSLLQQKIKAEKVVSNIDRQIEEMKLKISQDLK